MEPKIPLEVIESSNLAAIGYDPDRKQLAVQFKSGDVFHYDGVDMEFAGRFYAAESRGRFYAGHVKGKITGRKMTGKCRACAGGPGWIGETCTDCGTAPYVDTRPESA